MSDIEDKYANAPEADVKSDTAILGLSNANHLEKLCCTTRNIGRYRSKKPMKVRTVAKIGSLRLDKILTSDALENYKADDAC